MSVLPFPEGITSSADLQVWNNAAYDNEYAQDFSAGTQSWDSLKSIFGNPKESLDFVLGKENQGPTLENQISSVSLSNTPFKPVDTNRAVDKPRIKGFIKKGCLDDSSLVKQKGLGDGKKIDEEIEEIESEISRLSSRLEALRIEKANRSLKLVKRGRIVSAKFMEQNESVKLGDNSCLSARPKVNRRGLSLGPAEIVSARRSGMSIGPYEIVGAAKSNQFGRQETVSSFQSRRKSCFMKLQNIKEEKAVKSSSVSPKSRKNVTKDQVPLRQAVTTVSRKVLMKGDRVINSVQPKKLFKDGEKYVPATNKKPVRPGRVVASRYNQNAGQMRRSVAEDDGIISEKKYSLSSRKSDGAANECNDLGTESRVKKRWEIPSEIVVCCKGEDEEHSPVHVMVVPDLLPGIRIARLVNQSPRDSGPAKRVAELVGRKYFFTDGEALEGSVCQTLSYDDEE